VVVLVVVDRVVVGFSVFSVLVVLEVVVFGAFQKKKQIIILKFKIK
jgi:hypothetical protein